MHRRFSQHILSSFGVLILIAFSLSIATQGKQIYESVKAQIVIINTYPNQVEVSIQDKTYLIEPFEIKSVDKIFGESLDIKATINNEEIYSRSIQANGQTNILELITLTELEVGICNVALDVTNYYYPRLENQSRFDNFVFGNSLNLEPFKSFKIITPANSNIENFRTRSRGYETFVGIYPIECKDANNLEIIDSTVKLFQFYDRAEQFGIYNELKKDVTSLSENEVEREFYLLKRL